MLGLAAVPNVGVAIPAAFLVGLASILYMTSTTAIIQVEADPPSTDGILSLQTFIIGGTACIGGPILGWLADTIGARAPVILGGIVGLLAAGWGLVINRRVTRRAASLGSAPPGPMPGRAAA
jgi:MFS family permease